MYGHQQIDAQSPAIKGLFWGLTMAIMNEMNVINNDSAFSEIAKYLGIRQDEIITKSLTRSEEDYCAEMQHNIETDVNFILRKKKLLF